MTDAQRRAFERLWPRYGVDLGAETRITSEALFGNDRPLHLEIGFGNGDALLAMAAARPELNFVGIEVHRPGVGRLLRRLDEEGIGNVRVIRHDAMEVLRHHLTAGALAAVYLFFPDPWPKKKHHKRRIVQPEFIDLVVRALTPGGLLHMATDWEAYAEQMLELAEAHPGLDNLSGEGRFSPRPESRPLTRFEQRGARLGHGVWDLLFRRV